MRGRKTKYEYRSKEFQDTAIAWLKGEVSLTQINRALGIHKNLSSGNMLYGFSVALREAYRNKRITIK
jgi:hypothetical protein